MTPEQPEQPEQMEQLLAHLRARGLRITPQRVQILKLLLEHDEHLTAQEIHDRLRPLFPDLSLDTVYRTLRTLAVLGIVCQSNLQTPSASRFALAPGGHHHHHMICIECGTAMEIPDCPLPSFLDDVTARYGFSAAGHALEIYGYCVPCRDGGRRT